jgi:nucleolar MIF4G domain-containing protein 1
MKNYATIVSLLYNYGSISGDYIESFVQWLTQSLDKNNIELLYIIIQKCGVKVRQNDPSILKNIISIIKDAIEGYKQSHSS